MVGSIPVKDKKVKERVKQAMMEHLHQQYGMIEEDFLSAEIEAVPAFEVRDLGFDRSFIGGYGHDDRSSSYTALRAMLDIKGIPERTTLLFWSDKEEVGSYGATGAQSNFLYHVIGNILRLFDPAALDTSTRDLLSNSCALSGDVDAAFDPDYKDVHDERNTAQLNHGVTITKYTGVRGKYGANDADAEYVGKVRKLFNENGIVWQTGLISKVDVGGGGTIALYLAALGIHIVDCGPAVLSMHSPFEVISKADLFATYEAYKVFFEKMK
jgi:aspartyl aminopeptidase